MVAIADFRRSAETSLSTTSSPASAATCAIPLPIWPEPITPTFLIIAIFLSHPATRDRVSPFSLHQPRRKFVLPAGRLLSPLFTELAERFRQFRNRLIEIGDQAVIGDLENRRVFILVDRDDHLGTVSYTH